MLALSSLQREHVEHRHQRRDAHAGRTRQHHHHLHHVCDLRHPRLVASPKQDRALHHRHSLAAPSQKVRRQFCARKWLRHPLLFSLVQGRGAVGVLVQATWAPLACAAHAPRMRRGCSLLTAAVHHSPAPPLGSSKRPLLLSSGADTCVHDVVLATWRHVVCIAHARPSTCGCGCGCAPGWGSAPVPHVRVLHTTHGCVREAGCICVASRAPSGSSLAWVDRLT